MTSPGVEDMYIHYPIEGSDDEILARKQDRTLTVEEGEADA